MAEEKLILRVELDDKATQQRLEQLVLDIDATKAAQKELTAARKAGTIEEEAYAKRAVELKAQLRGQTQETATLTKNLELYTKAKNGEANSYQATQAALSLAIRQQQQLAGSADDSTEASQALTKQIAAYREQLSQTDAKQGAFFRNIGNYPKGSEGLTELVQQLITLQEQQKRTTAGTAEAEEVTRRIGFVQQAAAQAGGAQGKSLAEVTDFIQNYGEAIRPATVELLNLTEQQEQAAEAGQETGEAMQAIGFKIGQAKKEIKDATDALKEVPDTAEPATGSMETFGDSIAALDDTTGAFGGQVATLKQRFTTAKQGIDLAKGGFTGLKGAIASTGIGVLILALGALYEYFVSTDEGAEDLAAGMAFLKGLFAPIQALAIGTGKALVTVFTDPKKAGQELLTFIKDQLINRVTAFGVIWKGIMSSDFKQVGNGLLQYATGVENVIDKTQVLAAESKRAANAAYEISRAKDGLEDAERAEIVRTEENKNLIDKLVLSAKDRTLTEQQRLANLDKAGRLETETLNRTIALAKEKLRIQQLENAEAERTGTISDEARTQLEQDQADIVKLAGQSASLQQSIQNRRSVLLQQEAAEAKKLADQAAERRIAARRDALALDALLLEKQLTQVRANSDEELNLLQRKLQNAYQAELNVKNLTVSAKKVADQKYENESLALTLDFARRRLQAELASLADLSAARLANAQAGSTDVLQEQIEQVELNRRAQLAALKETDDNTAAVEKINAQAAQQRRSLEYQDSLRLLQDYLSNKQRLLDESYAKGEIGEAQYQRDTNALTRAGLDATANVNLAYNQDNTENNRKYGALEVKEMQRVRDETKKTEEAKQAIREQTVQAALTYTNAIISSFGEESDAGQAALALKKVLGIAEIYINTQKVIALNAVTAAAISASIPPPVGPVVGTAYKIAADALAITSAAAGVAEILKFQMGGIAEGPSHAQGGIPLVRRGRSMGIEIEGGEVIINRQSSAQFLPLLSAINQAGGGRPLVPNAPRPHLALGGVASALVRDAVNGVDGVDYNKLAGAMKNANIVVKTQDIARALDGQKETKAVSSTKKP